MINLSNFISISSSSQEIPQSQLLLSMGKRFYRCVKAPGGGKTSKGKK